MRRPSNHRLASHVVLVVLVTAARCSPTDDAGLAATGSTTTGTTDADPTPTEPTSSTGTTGTTGSTDPTGTTGSTGSGSTGEGTSTAPTPDCGNGVIDEGESCDDGHLLNNDNAYCTFSCAVNVCGDGLKHEGVEACDHGPNNNDKIYGGCHTNCTLGDHCGDFAVQPPEECDLGSNNGTGKAELGGVPCGQTCRYDARLCFLSSEVYKPQALGSAQAADARCRALALAAGLDNAGAFMAWISDDASSPMTRFTPSTLPYVLLNGVRVANSSEHLFAAGPLVGITHTDTREELPDQRVWTGTAADGMLADPTLDCENWTSNGFEHKAWVGRSSPDSQDPGEFYDWKYQDHWTAYATRSCTYQYRLYCFEQ